MRGSPMRGSPVRRPMRGSPVRRPVRRRVRRRAALCVHGLCLHLHRLRGALLEVRPHGLGLRLLTATTAIDCF
jgi:hypothetical protein